MTAGRLAAAVSRRLGYGNGSVIGGRVALALCPDVLARLAEGRTSVVVTGTNGKTTTSHLVVAALSGRGPVAHNAAGSNMPDGAVTALMDEPRARLCVLEVDELHLGAVLGAVRPDVLVLLNLSRDQLDRVSEVRATATGVARALEAHPETLVVANVDDPMVVWAVGAAERVLWCAAGTGWESDSLACPMCGHQVSRRTEGGGSAAWWCGSCGLRRPRPRWWWAEQPGTLQDGPDRPADGRGGNTFVLHHETARPVRVVSGLPGRVNRGNVTLALAAAAAIGTAPETAASSVAGVREVAGRYGALPYRNRLVRSFLVKNPAGWAEAVDMLAPGRALLIVINAREADGRDVSWLWDLPVGSLSGRTVAVAGDRAADLGVRLSYADISHVRRSDPLDALGELPEGEVDVVANYTAFRDLQRSLGGNGGARPRPGGGSAAGPPGRGPGKSTSATASSGGRGAP